MASRESISILFVCLGNICRSPAAEGNFRHLVEERGFAKNIRIDSAGTGAWHAGEPPNPNMRRAAAEAGVQLAGRARQFQQTDFEKFDYILAMDESNYADLLEQARTPQAGAKLYKFRVFDPEAGLAAEASDTAPETPDPYYGGFEGFRQVQGIAQRTSAAFLDWLCERHGLAANKA